MAKPKLEKNVNIPDFLMKDLLTPSEIRMLKNRFLIINLLKQGMSIRIVAERVKVGTDTVVRVSKMLSKPALKRYFESHQPSLGSTYYIFGKSEE